MCCKQHFFALHYNRKLFTFCPHFCPGGLDGYWVIILGDLGDLVIWLAKLNVDKLILLGIGFVVDWRCNRR